jgi:hypothetical protein
MNYRHILFVLTESVTRHLCIDSSANTSVTLRLFHSHGSYLMKKFDSSNEKNQPRERVM